MTRTVETANNDSEVDVTADDMGTPTSRESMAAMEGLIKAKRLSPEEQRRFFRNSRNFFE
jgi:hypothetical protein